MASCASKQHRKRAQTGLSRRFPDAYGHKRGWGKELTAFLESSEFNALLETLKSQHIQFTDLYTRLYRIRPHGIGKLLIYDIATQICRENGIYDERIYLFGNGPQNAAKLLNLPVESVMVKGCSLRYTTIPHVLEAFDSIGHIVPETLRHSKNGDDYESYLCIWQSGTSRGC